MADYLREELLEAERVIASLLSKCERAQEGLRPGSAQESLMVNRVAGLCVALELVRDAVLLLGDA